MSDYEAALGRLLATSSGGIKAGPERVQAVLAALGNPQRGLRGVLVAGTNGKGSVCALVESICRAAGLRTVLLVKPHLRSYRERVVIDGVPISGERFAELALRICAVAEQVTPIAGAPTQFELLTVLGILAAAEAAPDVLVCEVGLGGRMDATNVLELGVDVITSVAIDHSAILGDTVEEIAAEKAGIVKAGEVVISGAGGSAAAVVRQCSTRAGAAALLEEGRDWTVAGKSLGLDGIAAEVTVPGWGAILLRCPLRGEFQLHNLGIAVAVATVLAAGGAPIDAECVRRGCERVTWPGRVQWIPGRPSILLDAAHNPAAAAALAPVVRELSGAVRPVLLFAAMADKDSSAMIAELRGLFEYAVMTQPDTPRARSAVELARQWGTGARAVNRLADALTVARVLAGEGGVVVACGSLYLVGEVLDAVEMETGAIPA